MIEQKSNHLNETDEQAAQASLKKALIAFAIIEALVIIPIVLYKLFR
jgi:hypothetical protein